MSSGNKNQPAADAYGSYQEATWEVTVVVKVPRQWTARDIENVVQNAVHNHVPYIDVETRMPARVARADGT